jgi:hypothetical protein
MVRLARERPPGGGAGLVEASDGEFASGNINAGFDEGEI